MFRRRGRAGAAASATAVTADPTDKAQTDTVIGTTEDPSQAPLMEHLRELRQRLGLSSQKLETVAKGVEALAHAKDPVFLPVSLFASSATAYVTST